MSRRFLSFPETTLSKKTGNWELSLWLLLHLAVPALFLLSLFFKGPVNINTSLFDMLPQSSQSRAVMEADKILGERNGREIVILAAAADFDTAKNGAVLFYNEFESSAEIEKISFYFDSSAVADFNRYLFDYRFVIAGTETLALLETGMADKIADDALASAFGAFNFFSLDNIEHDPFLLAERRMGDFLSSSLLSGAIAPKEDVLAVQADDTWYVMLRLTLSPGAVSLQADKNAVGKIYAATNAIKDNAPGLNFYFSGIPFHSYESSSGAQKEISVISTVTILLILFLFLYAFRSPLPVISSIAAILISLGMATGTALLVFREIHIITFVFGTTLIGTCVDYSVHFFVYWKGNKALKSGAEIRAHIIKNVTMSFISTQVCFIVFLFAPFPILKQFAIFCMAGLLSSYLSFFCIYPRLKVPPDEKRKPLRIFTMGKSGGPDESSHSPIPDPCSSLPTHHSLLPRFGSLLKKCRPVLLAVLVLAAVIILFLNSSKIKIENNLSSLYTMSDSLLESEKRTSKAMGYGSPGWYYIVSGSTIDETLDNEEKLASRLEEEKTRGNLEAYLSTSFFVPSMKTQKRTYTAMKALLPLADSQFEHLGFPPQDAAQYAQIFKKEFAAAEKYCFIEDAPSNAGVSNLWIGEQGGRYYSCVMPIKPYDEAIFRSVAGEFDDVYFINKSKDIGRDLDTLTKTMLFLFVAAYVIVSVIIFLLYPRRDSFKICSVPFLLVLAALTVLAANSISIGFFSMAALVLVFGLSLDYIFFLTGKKSAAEKNFTLLGVILSFLTTLLSFGALALSSFMPVHLFGLTVSVGLGAAFISAIILQSRKA